MKIENLLTKRSRLDRRFKFTKNIDTWFNRYTRASALYGLIIGSLVGAYIADNPAKHQETSPKTLETNIEVKAIENTPTHQISWNDAIRQVFPSDEAGRMIRICLKENRAQNKYATNHNSNGTYDYSWCQINSCHKPKNMSDEEWKENLENPVFHAQQVREIYLSQGWNAWSVYKFGLIK